MTLAERHDFIMDLLQQQGSVSVAALAERLKVSEVTIRKDLTLLEEKKMLYRAHGSAILINPYINDRPVNEKEKHNAAEKRAIGIRAASLVTPDDSILIASGTTMLFLAREIKAQGRLTVITSAVNIVPILVRDHNVDVVQLGGMVRNTSVSAVGVYAERMLQDFSCSKLYLGVDGIDLEYGLSTTNLMEAGLNRAMIRTAQKTIVLADSSKFGRRGFSKICDLSDVDQIITDSNVSPHTLAQLRSQGCTVIVCTHELSLIEPFADVVLMLAAGKLRASGSVAELRRQANLPAVIRGFDAAAVAMTSASKYLKGDMLCVPDHDVAEVVRVLTEETKDFDFDIRRAGLSEIFRAYCVPEAQTAEASA